MYIEIYMESFYQTLTTLSKENTHIRLEKERQTQIAHQMKIKDAMDALFQKIAHSGVNDAMTQAASNGYTKYELFSFERGECVDDLPLIFLTRGPQNYNGFGLKYFEDINVNPYIKQLQHHFSPFNVYFSTNYKSGKTSIMISW